MRIVCPACEAEYDVPDTVAGGGRKVRCARCQTVWFATDAAAEPAPPPEAADAAPATFAAMAEATAAEADAAAADESAGDTPTLVAEPLGVPPGRAGRRRGRAMEDLAADPAAEDGGGRRGMRALVPWMVAWVLSLAVLGGLGWAGVHWRAEVVRLWPASQRLYAVLGAAADGNPPVTSAH